MEMLGDDQFRLELHNGIFDRIEEIVSICGSDNLTDKNGNAFYIDGEEEKGFSSERFNLKIEKQISVDTQVTTETTIMKTTLMIEGKKKLSIEIGYDDLSSIVSSLPDSSDFEEVFNVLAAHPSATVRESIAGKDKINEETVNILASDSDAVVIRALVRSDAARDTLTTEQLIEMIKRDVDTAENIAGYVESYNNAEADDIAEALAQHSDPRVRNALAGNSSSPKKILKNLLKDEDPRVRASAKQSLE
jgi:Asp-tRNA(Asn)/Glu-tRNA(Gln) amidotransferase C subunit